MSERWVLSDGTVVRLDQALTIEGTSALADVLRRELTRQPPPNVGVGEHLAPLDPRDRDSVSDWLVLRAYQHGARLVDGYTGPPRPPPPPGAMY